MRLQPLFLVPDYGPGDGARPTADGPATDRAADGAERSVYTITTGLGWVKAAEHVVVSGKPSKADLEACWNLGATVAAQLME